MKLHLGIIPHFLFHKCPLINNSYSSLGRFILALGEVITLCLGLKTKRSQGKRGTHKAKRVEKGNTELEGRCRGKSKREMMSAAEVGENQIQEEKES